MKIYSLLLIGMFFSINVLACEQDDTEIISCSLVGEASRNVSFCLNKKNQEINYYFKRAGKIELNVLFNIERKLKRLTDENMGVTYLGFSKGQFGYILSIINGAESEEYSMSFDIKKDNKIIQTTECSSNSYRSDNIVSKYIENIPYNSVKGNEFIFP
ncbi:hypothetical protein [Ewingella americana]|uniref:Lipoprotein n=1 Tax=Ewingella americana TaxID=41202 RepID=A0A502G0I4_9GAMM|nr:hypothetical protein [Ewingella americana]TPG55417.1 hypothetical protein EAH77_23645 [Ewingella americana]